MDAPTLLSHDSAVLKQQLLSALTRLDAKDRQIETHQRDLRFKDVEIALLHEKLRLLIHKRFGASAEGVDVNYQLFDEAEVETLDTAAHDAIEVPAHQRAQRGRKALPDHLPRVEVIHDLADADDVGGSDFTPQESILEIFSYDQAGRRYAQGKDAQYRSETRWRWVRDPLDPKSGEYVSYTVQVSVSARWRGINLHRCTGQRAAGHRAGNDSGDSAHP